MKSLSHYIISQRQCSTTVCLILCRNLLQYLKKPFKSVFLWRNNLKFCTVASTKDLYYTTKNQISVADTLVCYTSFLSGQNSNTLQWISVKEYRSMNMQWFCNINSFSANIGIINKPVNWVADQIKWLVSIWNQLSCLMS